MRTHTCGELNEKDNEKTVTLCGWVHRRRDLGGLVFVDLRDRYGLIQLLFDPVKCADLHKKAESLKSEWVISVTGTVILRKAGMINKKMATGQIEIAVSSLTILSKSKVLPFTIHEDLNLSDELRLKYRYLDLRKGNLVNNLTLRHKVLLEARKYLDELSFTEINTPILGKSTPEGARDYLVPSRVYPGNFYALPQSPQIFKQLLMVAGLDRYFQVSPCFRDEDLRADRQPEFYQVDIEMSFSTVEKLYTLLENLCKRIFKICLGKELKTPFKRLTYAECIENYGTDKPDLRFEMPLVRIDDLILGSSFSLLKNQIEKGASCKAICVKEGAELSRKQIEKLITLVQQFSLPGLAWMKMQEGKFTSNIVKFFPEQQLVDLQNRLEVEDGDLVLIGASSEKNVNQGMDHLRRHLAKTRDLISNTFEFLWVVDFPLFEKDPDTGRITAMHHLFTHPYPEDIEKLDTDPLSVRSNSYDLVLNGYELGSGSQRIHDSDLQKKIFDLLGLTPTEIETKFGFFVEALQYGTPPHLGIALGVERLIMVLCKTENIRDVVAFPKTTKAADLMLQAPSSSSEEQLQELEIQAKPEPILWP